MAHIKVTIDGKVEMDGELGQFTTEPPLISAQKLAIQNRKAAPWSMPLLTLISSLGLRPGRLDIEISTHQTGFTIGVNHG